MKNKKLPIEELMPLSLCAAGAMGIFPFAVIRFGSGDLPAALLDTGLVSGLAGLAYYLYRSHNVRLVSVLLAVLCLSGVLLTVRLQGPDQVFWVFPALLATYFLIRRREALLATVLVSAALIPMLQGTITSIQLTTIVITTAVSSAFAYAFATMTRVQRRELLKLASKDPLTGAGNRRALTAKLDEIIAKRNRSEEPSSMLMLDLDHFKKVNDEFGHAMGDQILMRVTEIINMRIRVTDSVYRIGGEEFVVLVEGTDLERAHRLAEQLRTIVDANDLLPSGKVTVSLGVAEHLPGESALDWCHRADDALYRAKHSGRNMIRLAAA